MPRYFAFRVVLAWVKQGTGVKRLGQGTTCLTDDIVRRQQTHIYGTPAQKRSNAAVRDPAYRSLICTPLPSSKYM